MSRRAYHHGDLKRALMDAALHLVVERGARGFSLSEAARHVGVTTAAPYRHFADKEALLAAVATEGFEALVAGMSEVPPGDAVERFLGIGEAYVRFAVGHPALHGIMFDTPHDKARHPELDAAAERAFGHLVAAAHAVVAEGGAGGDPLVLAFTSWSLVHGAARLHATGVLDKKGVDPAAVARAGVRQLLVGSRAGG